MFDNPVFDWALRFLNKNVIDMRTIEIKPLSSEQMYYRIIGNVQSDYDSF